MHRIPPGGRIMIGLWIQHVGRAWRAATDAAFADFGLSSATGTALIYVHRLGGKIRQGELARCMGIEGPTLVRLADQLCAANLVQRRDDATDRRAKHIEITPQGRAVIERVERALDEVRDRLLAEVSPQDLAATQRVLQAIAAATGDTLPVPAASEDVA